jgi:predicted ABC-type transport system involved in lysophospholipase L1 biosynthesis ATPase subunit
MWNLPTLGMLSCDETEWFVHVGQAIVMLHSQEIAHMVPTTASRHVATFPPGAPLIRVEHLTRTIATRAQRTVILDNVTFTIFAQSLFAINGPSGSGKSTLLNLLTGIDRPTSGRVVFAGHELRAQGENALARWRGGHVGIIFQFFQLVPKIGRASCRERVSVPV